MMGSDGPPVTPITITKPSSFNQRRPSSSNPQTIHHPTPPHSAKFSSSAISSPLLPSPTTPETKGVSHLNIPDNLYYLHNAERERPLVYQSPYSIDGGFTKPYLPAPDASPKARPRGPSMSEHFLSKQNHTYKEEVARKMSEDKVRLQQENRERVQRRLSQSQAQRPIMMAQYPPQTQPPQHVSMSAIQDLDSHKNSHPSHRNPYFTPTPTSTDLPPLQSYSHYSPAYPTNPTYHPASSADSYPNNNNHHQHHQHPSTYPHPTTHQPYYHPSSSHHPPPTYGKPASLQFSSPQDFQMQMERAAAQFQRPGFQNGYGSYQGLPNAAATVDADALNGAGESAGDGGVGGGGVGAGAGGGGDPGVVGGKDGGQGSPLKFEMGGGGETLPMMRDRSNF